MPVCQEIELIADGNAVGVARDVPYFGRLFKYRHRQGDAETLFRFRNRDRADYVSGYRFWLQKGPTT